MSEMVVYQIKNMGNNKCYIGSTVNKTRRWQKHRDNLERGTHSNPYLQNAYEKCNKSSFKFFVIEKVQKEENLLDREDFYLKYFNYYIPEILYNIAEDAKSSMWGRKHSQKAKQRISEAASNPSEETRKKMSRAHEGKKFSEKTKKKISEANKGREFSEEHKQKLSEAQKGKKHTEKAKEKISRANSGKNHPLYGKTGKDAPIYGKEHSEKAKEKISEANSKLTKKKVKVIKHLLNGNHFTQAEIGKMYGVTRGTIGKIATCKNWSRVKIGK